MLEVSKRGKKRTQTKQTIAEASLGLFFKKGLNETSVAEIMEKASLGIGTFYNYFESKEAVLKYCLAEKIDLAGHACENIQLSKLSPTQKLIQILQVVGRTYDKNQKLVELYLRYYHDSDIGKKEPPHGGKFVEILKKIVLEGQSKNEFRKDIPYEIIVETFTGILKITMGSDSKLTFMENINFKYSILLEGIIRKKE